MTLLIHEIDPSLYVTRLEELLWAGVLVAATMGIHGLGKVRSLRFDNTFKGWVGERPSFAAGLTNLILVSGFLVTVHTFEVAVWAGFLLWKGCFGNFSTAKYFALNECTTVGSSLHLPRNWRLLQGGISTAGLPAFAWSTGVLLTLARDVQAQQVGRREPSVG